MLHSVQTQDLGCNDQLNLKHVHRFLQFNTAKGSPEVMMMMMFSHVSTTVGAAVFYYEPSVYNGIPVNHNVYLLHDAKQFRSCGFGGKASLLADTTQGKDGYRFTLSKRKKTYYFACAVGGGIHCNEGLMKFHVKPL
mgnify:CR=1 FL=1